MKKTILITAAVLCITPYQVFAQKTYTPQQLNSMVRSGNPPQQGPATSQSDPMSFDKCKHSAKQSVNAISGSYPSQQILNTPDAYMIKVWTNDSSVLITCSKPDQKMVITKSNYK